MAARIAGCRATAEYGWHRTGNDRGGRRFGRRLHGRFNLPVEWHDERLSTYEALDHLGIHSKMDARQRSDVDQLSAQLILQSWLNQ